MSFKMGNNVFVLFFTLILFVGGVCSVSVPSSPARIVNGFLSNVFSVLMKWILSLKAATKTAISGRPMMKFESGYNVKTVFDGSKLGVEPYSVEVLPGGNLLILDSANSNLYTISSSSLSLYSRPKLVMGSAEGYYGHIDGRLREARMNHPKGLTVDDRGNIYVADTDNMAIRKISDTGVSTIAGGKRGLGGHHVDGPSEDAKFSNDFDVFYIGSSCSILVIDRGNKAIREIQLHFDDCTYQYGSGFPLGVGVPIAAGFFGYMLAIIQRKVCSMASSQNVACKCNYPHLYLGRFTWSYLLLKVHHAMKKHRFPPYQHQTPLKTSLQAPLITNEDKQENQEESFLVSFGRLVTQTGASAGEILGGLIFPSLKPSNQQQRQQHHKYSNVYPVQESFLIPDEDSPPTTTPRPLKSYTFMPNDSEKMQKLRRDDVFYSGLGGDNPLQQRMKKQQHQYCSSPPQTYFQD